MILRRALVIVVVACTACGGSKQSAIAELTRVDGPVDREQGKGPWNAAQVGAEFFDGDAARTADGGAELKVAGTAQLAMLPHTILRFGGSAHHPLLRTELGKIKLTGGGEFSTAIGNVKLGANGELTITASDITLTGGTGTRDVDGQISDLALNVAVAVTSELGSATITARDAAPDAPLDAGTPDASDTSEDSATVDVLVGKKVEIQAPGETKWTTITGPQTLAKGTKVRVGDKSKAKLVGKGITLELGPASRALLGDQLVFAVELGGGTATATAAGKVAVPGGAVAMTPTKDGPAEVALDVGRNGETKVKVMKPDASIDDKNGKTVELGRDETATLTKSGAIHQEVRIPAYFDFALPVGESATVHDPKPPTAVKFDFNGKCPNGGYIEVSNDGKFRAPGISRGKESANLSLGGGWAYRLRCGEDGGPIAAQGRVSVIRDDGRRRLPDKDPTFRIEDEGRPITFDYQSQIPSFEFRAKGGGRSFVLHLASGGKDETFDSATPTVTVPSKQLHEGLYTFYFERDGVKGKVSTLKIGFDNKVAQVYIQSPPNGKPFEGDVAVAGLVVPGWTAKVGKDDVPMDAQHRFRGSFPPPAGKAFAIRLYNPKRGVHYFLCRP